MDAALQADLRRAAGGRLGDPRADLVEREVVAGTAQAARAAPLGEGAEAAGVRADVGVVDVAVDHEGDRVAHRPRAQRIGGAHHGVEVRAVGVEQRLQLLLGQAVAARRTRQGLEHRPRGRRGGVEGALRRKPPVARQRRRARPRAPRTLGGISQGIDAPQHRGAQRGVHPARHIARIRGDDRQPLHEPPPRRLGLVLERRELGPRRLGVHMVRRDRRYAAPVVGAGREQRRERARAQVGRRLDRHAGAEDEPRDGDRPLQLLERGLRMLRHARARLGAEVLDDEFLDVAVPQMHGAQREQRFDALRAGLADADEETRGHRDGEAPRRLERGEPRGGLLVGRAMVRSALLRQTLRAALEHQAHRHRDRPQHRELGLVHDARVEVRQQPRLLEDAPRAVREVLERGRETERGELLAGGAVAQLGLVAEREQRLVAARGGARPGDGEHLIDAHVGPCAARRRRREGAVMADITAQMRQRDEHLARVADARPEALPRELGGAGEQPRQAGLGLEQPRLRFGHRFGVEIVGHIHIVRQTRHLDATGSEPQTARRRQVRLRAVGAELRRERRRQLEPQRVGARAASAGHHGDIQHRGPRDQPVDLGGGHLRRVGGHQEHRVRTPGEMARRELHRGVEPGAVVVQRTHAARQHEALVGRDHPDLVDPSCGIERGQHARQHAAHEVGAATRREDGGEPRLALARRAHRHHCDDLHGRPTFMPSLHRPRSGRGRRRPARPAGRRAAARCGRRARGRHRRASACR